MIGKTVLRIFLLPGDLVCDAVGVSSGDDRLMLRSLINMLAWSLVAVVAVVALW